MTRHQPERDRTIAGAPPPAPTILVLYYADHAPLRTAIADHLFSTSRYAAARTIYLNVAVRRVPAWIERLQPDLIVFHTTLLAQRWHPPTFDWVQRRLRRLRGSAAIKVALPQDEFIHTDQLCEFLRSFGVDHVLTCAAEHDWPVIYGDLVGDGVHFRRVLTGYLEPRTVARIGDLAKETGGGRDLDLVYRAWRPEFWLGRHAQLKGTLADVFEREGPAHGLRTDISVREEDTLIGDAWFRLLLRARWTIGVEGGASVIDRDGSLRERTLAFVAAHPEATYEEAEAACFPGLEGSLALLAISPRHLEACATRTAQVLVDGDYNGILEPGTHYLALRKDLSNLSDILSAMTDDALRLRLADRAYADVVTSRRFEYSSLVELIEGLADGRTRAEDGLVRRVLLGWESRIDRPSWLWVRVRQRVRPAVRAALARLGLLPSIQRIRSRAAGTGRT